MSALPRALRLAYRDIPAMACRPGCSDCCGIVPWSKAELDRVADRMPPDAVVTEVRGQTVVVSERNPLQCPFIAPGGGCSIYDHRPFMCRLFGTAPSVPHLRCPHGCRPARALTAAQAARMATSVKESEQYAGSR